MGAVVPSAPDHVFSDQTITAGTVHRARRAVHVAVRAVVVQKTLTLVRSVRERIGAAQNCREIITLTTMMIREIMTTVTAMTMILSELYRNNEDNNINPFTAPACQISRQNDARTGLQTVGFPAL